VGKPKGKRPLGRSRRKWKENVKWDLRKTELDCVDWVNLALDRDKWWSLVNTVMNYPVP
jgi:hypothetical protein